MIDWGCAQFTQPGQQESGDGYVVQAFAGGALVGVIDGLGHGPEAADATRRAVEFLATHAQETVITLVRQAHERLQATRGVVMSLASFNAAEHTMTWVGVGNVAGYLLRSDATVSPLAETILRRGGVVGYQLPALRAALIPVSAGDTLVFATDGIREGALEAHMHQGPPQQLARQILESARTGADDALVLVARYVESAEVP